MTENTVVGIAITIYLTVYKTVVHSPVATIGYSCATTWRSAASSLRELTAADFLEEGFLGVWPSTSTEWAFYVQVAVPMRLLDAGRLDGSNPPGSRLLANLRLAVV